MRSKPPGGQRRRNVSPPSLPRLFVYIIQPGVVCRPGQTGAALEMSPKPGAAPFPHLVVPLGHWTRCGCCGGSCWGVVVPRPQETRACCGVAGWDQDGVGFLPDEEGKINYGRLPHREQRGIDRQARAGLGRGARCQARSFTASLLARLTKTFAKNEPRFRRRFSS